jgi:hypothetical protein
VRASHKECACEEWQHTGLPCQHVLCLIIAQPFRNVKMEEFVHEYYSVEKFQNTYKRVMTPLCDKSFWPEVDIGVSVGAPLGKRLVGRQRKNRFKSCLEGGSGKKTTDKDKEKQRKWFVVHLSDQILESWVIERIVLIAASMAHRKGNIASY